MSPCGEAAPGGPSRTCAVAAFLSAVCTTGCNTSQLAISVADEVGTVATATWEDAGRPTRIVVEGPDGEWLRTAWQDPSEGGHEASIVGLYPDEGWVARVDDEGGAEFDGVSFRTAPLPSDFPSFEIVGEPGWEGYFTTSFLGDTSTVVVMDEQARVVWYKDVDNSGRVLRARLRPDGSGVRYASSMQTDPDQQPSIDAAAWNGGVTSHLDVPFFSHDFVEAEDGTLGLLLFDVKTVEGFEPQVYGNSAVELYPEGGARTVWSTFDIWDPSVAGTVQEDGTWTHGNAIDLDEDKGTYTLGFRGVDAIVEVDRDSGETLRQVGGPSSTYAFADKDDQPFDQHQFQWLDDGILVFDNHTEDVGSRALELVLDDDALTATPRWIYAHDPVLWSYAMGDVDRGADGSTLITWSSSGVISDVGPDGELRWELSTEFATGIGFTERVAALPGIERVR